jgi:RNA-directed DNA polymerase
MQHAAIETEGLSDWDAVDWCAVNKRVRNLRRRIFKAERTGDQRKVRSLQKLMLRSTSNTLWSVRRVTQHNHGRDTPGVDKVVVKTPAARLELVRQLQHAQPWRAQPVKRIFIPKQNGKLRPLGIATIADRAMQTRVKNALEPQWEARFEPRSYGFRPGRSAHDAIEAIFILAKPGGRRPWVVDADLQSAFDKICHTHLFASLSGFPAQHLIKQWLEAGVMENGVLHETPRGAPQGGPLSPLLLNIALHGMDQALGVRRIKRDKELHPESRAVVRYADDLVVFCATREEAKQTIADLSMWLAERGLALSEEKTRVVHIKEGFDFLGFNVRQYDVPETKRGAKLFIRPSKASVKRLRTRLRQEWQALAGANAATVIKRLAPIMTGWANYYQSGVSAKVFDGLDHFMTYRALRYTKRRHPKKSAQWRFARYFGRRNPRRNDRWVFGDDESGKYLPKFSWTRIERHVMVKGDASPDDASLATYWQRRTRKTGKAHLEPKYHWLAYRQGYRCPVCGESLANGEVIERHHLILDKSEPARDDPCNMRLVHLFCHDQIHSGKRPTVTTQLLCET